MKQTKKEFRIFLITDYEKEGENSKTPVSGPFLRDCTFPICCYNML